VYCDGAGSGAEVVELSAGFDPEDYLPLSGGTMTGNLNHGDSVKAQFGAGNDLQIYHDGSNSYIKNNTGVMRIHGTEVQIKDEDNNETLAVFNPQGSVDLYYDNSKKLATSSTGADVTGNLLVTGNAEAVVNIQGTTAGGSFVNFGDNTDANVGQIGYDHTSNYMRFKTADTERMRIDSSGNVGIGVTNPSNKFQVSDSAGGSIASFTNTTSADLSINLTAGVSLISPSTGILALGTSNTERMRIDSSGNVGINDSSPSHKLDVNGNIAVSQGSRIYLTNDSGFSPNITNKDASNAMQFLTGNVERMRIDSSGNVGIGTSSPQAKMHIDGGSSSNILQLSNTAVGSTGSDGVVLGMSASDVYFFNRENTAFRFGTNNTERMRIDNSGNLLVGTTSASTTVAGARLKSVGRGDFTVDGGTCSVMNRLTNDGNHIQFEKDGTTVGSIGVTGGDLMIGQGSVGIRFLDSAPALYPTVVTTGATASNTIDVGTTAAKFKDAHFYGTVNAANFNTTSDATLKTNVETLTGSLDAVKAMRGVSYDWIESGNSEVGVIAQEVEAIVPDVVSTDDQGIKSVKYGNLVGVLIEAIKEQQAQIDELKAKLGD